ncbi:hypothetical protein GCM10027160_54480 [Streptomyces calidiresistens]|uniref:Uncharacterized protein n=1 Tax=Streptomyces calidiresistens TaxID=1485586 RepID=A0A7W3T208_9ACTN|nr:hypothetical protein [Streptomyces calidiresistens]MBB0229465.1 hypothetical protein [Streptomyces calidiresistens]
MTGEEVEHAIAQLLAQDVPALPEPGAECERWSLMLSTCIESITRMVAADEGGARSHD